MDVRLATDQDKERWNKLVISSPQSSFMQSWEWGDMQESFGLPVWRFVAEEKGVLVGLALVVQRNLSLGRCWLYVPQGPLFARDPKLWQLFNDKLRELGLGKRAIFLRCDPALEVANGNDALLLESGWQKSEREVQPRHTLVIDLEQEESVLLEQMHNKTRYNIRLAARKGVTVRFSRDKKDMESFLELTKEVEGRGLFRYHPPHYYWTMLDVLGSKGLLEIAVAEGAGRTLAVNLLIKFGDRVTYGHGASGLSKRELMGPHSLQWESIKRVKGEGFKSYDLFGVAADGSDTNHPWAGITRFKLGFGGRQVDLVGAHDLVLDRTFYSIYNVARRMRGALR